MNRSVRISLSVWLAFVVVMQSVVADDDPELATIRAAVDFYQSSLHAVEGRYVTDYARDDDTPLSSNSTMMEGLTSETTFALELTTGRLFLDERDSWKYSKISPDGRFGSHSTRVFDGKQSFALVRSLTACPIATEVPMGQPYRLNVFNKDTLRVYFGPWHVAGLRTHVQGLPLAELLRQTNTKIVGDETIDGAACVLVAVDWHGVRCHFWLDPKHDFLPRRQQYLDVETNRLIQTVAAADFLSIDDPVHQNQRWFPSRGSLQLDIHHKEIAVQDIKINSSLEDRRFVIDESMLPDGVQVNPEGKSRYYTGNRDDIWKQLDNQMAEETLHMRALMGISDKSVGANKPMPREMPARVPLVNLAWLGLTLACLLMAWGLVRVIRTIRPVRIRD